MGYAGDRAPASRASAAPAHAARADAQRRGRSRDPRRLSGLQSARRVSAAHAAGVPVLYYITPKVWAWRAGRSEGDAPHDHARGGDPSVRGGVSARSEASRRRMWAIRCSTAPRRSPRARRRARSSASPRDARVLALFPGSRRGELAQHLDAFVATAHELERRIAGLRVIVSVAPGMHLDRTRARPFSSSRATRTPCGARPMRRS